MPNRSFKSWLSAVFVVVLSLTVAKAKAQLVTVDYPGATETDCNDINKRGTVVGFYTDSALAMHGFLLSNGAFRTINHPAATATLAYGINNNNDIVGWYTDKSGVTHGFQLSNNTYTTIDPPGSTFTNAWAINDAGTIVGAFIGSDSKYHGFIDVGGTYTQFDVSSTSTLTEITGINTNGNMTGIYDDNQGLEHGFTVINGHVAAVNYPASGVDVTATDRINDKGTIVGLYGFTTTGPFSGYMRQSGTYTTVTYPDSTETRVRGLNNAGVLVGRYTDTASVIHGFMGTP
jgi:probable HAF family extracellular repeat protein